MAAKGGSIMTAKETEDQQRQYSVYIHINPGENK